MEVIGEPSLKVRAGELALPLNFQALMWVREKSPPLPLLPMEGRKAVLEVIRDLTYCSTQERGAFTSSGQHNRAGPCIPGFQ